MAGPQTVPPPGKGIVNGADEPPFLVGGAGERRFSLGALGCASDTQSSFKLAPSSSENVSPMERRDFAWFWDRL